ncbi:MAG: hypothetical protein BGO41_01530 [Clostridiales bacterium 38-18]|nr:MAG: hypothetical protein BGO41_01530 [Clostridiales bacterium 38-18]
MRKDKLADAREGTSSLTLGRDKLADARKRQLACARKTQLADARISDKDFILLIKAIVKLYCKKSRMFRFDS